MATVEALSEEESYLYAILQDASGLDLAEFTWVEERNADGIFRCWPFQWRWWRSLASKQIDSAGRSVGKSLSIQARAFAFPFVHPNQEMVITGPEGIHVDAVTDLIETRFYSVRLGREMMKGPKFKLTHKPFHLNLMNGTRIMGRIPQPTGRGVKGVHPLWLEMDEAQDYPDRGWSELIETLQTGIPGAVWRAHGVTRGVRDKFFELTDETNPDNDWKVHRITAMHRPNWTDRERQEKIRLYGSKEDPDYRRNIMGFPGDATQPMFVLNRLMACVDDDKGSDYNTNEYYLTAIADSMLREGESPADYLYLPDRHIDDYKTEVRGRATRARYWFGIDVGYTRDPTEILVFVETRPGKRRVVDAKGAVKWVPIPKDEQQTVQKLLTRVTLRRVSGTLQARTIISMMGFYKPVAVCMDKTGLGVDLFQKMQEQSRDAASKVKGYGFSEKHIVEIDETIEVDPWTGDVAKEAGIKRGVLEWSFEKLREMVDNQQLYFPWDRNLIAQFEGSTKSAGLRGQDQYGRSKIFTGGEDHALDACRMMAMGYKQETIEELLGADNTLPILDQFVPVMDDLGY